MKGFFYVNMGLFFNQLIIEYINILDFSILFSIMVNINSYNPHEQKLLGGGLQKQKQLL